MHCRHTVVACLIHAHLRHWRCSVCSRVWALPSCSLTSHNCIGHRFSGAYNGSCLTCHLSKATFHASMSCPCHWAVTDISLSSTYKLATSYHATVAASYLQGDDHATCMLQQAGMQAALEAHVSDQQGLVEVLGRRANTCSTDNDPSDELLTTC